MKKNIRDLELIINNIIKEYELHNSDLLCSQTRCAISEMIINLYSQFISKYDPESLKDDIDKLLNYRILVLDPIYDNNDINIIKHIILNLKKTPQPKQRTEEWHTFRNNRLTASDLATAIDKNPYSTRNKLILSKCGIKEDWNPGPAILHGVKYEDVAIEIYKSRNNVNVVEYGCIPHSKINCFGASPDGIVDYDSENINYIGRMLEIKCPSKRPITGFIPKYYFYQVQGQLEVCDLEYCDFLECKITEYDNKEEYFNDGDFDYTQDGYEKGIIIDMYDYEIENTIYKYAPLGIMKTEFEKWENDTINNIIKSDNLEYIQTSFWKLEDYNCLLIKRDKIFWTKIKPLIINFWNDVLKYRKIGCKDLIKKKKIRNYTEKDTLLFLDD